jgi:hypothetical protein
MAIGRAQFPEASASGDRALLRWYAPSQTWTAHVRHAICCDDGNVTPIQQLAVVQHDARDVVAQHLSDSRSRR